MKRKIFVYFFIFFLISAISAGISLQLGHLKKIETIKAGGSNNVYGWAWSKNIGWISFNSTTGGGSVSYGVNIGNDGTLSGYAWSENIGWISFNESDLSGCPQAPCKAWVDTNTGNIYGWAKALSANDSNSGGWDGWIHLRGSNYGVKINFSASPAEFEDWAWGGDDNSNEANIGWISFNCNNSETGNVCSQSNYKVYTSVIFNSAPQVQNPHISSQDYCVAEQTGRIVFEWTYSDPDSDPETRFDLRINDINNVNDPNPEVDRTISGLNNPSPTTNNQSVFVVSSYQSDKLQYNKTYYWWVRLWDNQGNNSGWQYAGSFTTAHHAYPYVSFTWNPEEPTVEEVVQFTNQTKCYDINNNEVNCSSYLWTIPPTAEFANETNQFSKDPQIIFHETGNDIPVTLRATDPSGFSCEKTTNIQINAPLPGWTEVPPK